MSVSRRSSPAHVAIIMDGNGRWAKARHLPRTAGHQQGVTAARNVVRWCANHDVEVLTLFAFSSENWRRPETEVGFLMELFFTALQREARRLAENGVRMRFIGDRSAFSDRLQQRIAESEQTTSGGRKMLLNIAANYGGRWDIVNATRMLVEAIRAGELRPEQVNEQVLAGYLSTAGLPDPDLFIRTGGERRISNFLLWQLAYTELYFVDVLWPDFDEAAIQQAFSDYATRQRRFGKTGEQVEEASIN